VRVPPTDADADQPRGQAALSVEGVVIEVLPSALYRVEVDGRRRITAHRASGGDRNFVRILVGDRVEVALMPRDVTRGRIIRKV
jgi:translation initiation factor IF-1